MTIMLLFVVLIGGSAPMTYCGGVNDRELDKVLQDLERRPDSDSAWKKLLELAQQGNAAAQYAAANHYLWHLHDQAEHDRWERKAAENGYEVAQLSIANELLNTRRNKEAVIWVRRWANEGREWAESCLAHLYGNGWGGLAKDYGKALEWYKKALYTHAHMLAQKPGKENADRYAEIGDLYRKGGHGIRRDVVRAYACYRIAIILNAGSASKLVPNPEPHVVVLEKELSTEEKALSNQMAERELGGGYGVVVAR